MRTRFSILTPYVALFALAIASLACSSVDDVIGQRPDPPTPTVAVFSTATPGGRISISLEGENTTGGGSTAVADVGQIIAPAATATAAYATMQAATATAAAPIAVPFFQPSGECPQVGSPASPDLPLSFSQYPEAIGRYLSAGAAPTLVESTLRQWGAIADGAFVQADTDLTGDGVVEVVVTLYDPLYYQPGSPSPGQLLVFGCAQGGYRLLANTTFTPTSTIPELRRVGDMNGDFRAELVYTQQTCAAGRCTQVANILSWNATLGVFKALNELPIEATNGRVGIGDPDNDGVLELAITFVPSNDPAAGPQRGSTDIYDWDTSVYRLAYTVYDPPQYRVHALHDADVLFVRNDWAGAIDAYNAVRDNPVYAPWGAPNEAAVLRAYAGLKKMLAQISDGSRRAANNTFATLEAENPPGTAGEGYVVVAREFLQSYRRNEDRARACGAAITAAAARPDTLSTLNSYGYANRAYTLNDLCPFTVP
jgi:hypothetical protein